jgi:PAS domain S-box-containing protein
MQLQLYAFYLFLMTRLFRQFDWFSTRLRAVFLFLLLVSLFLSIPLPVSAEKTPQIDLTPAEQAWLKAHPVITLGGGIFPPLDFVDGNSRAEGLGPDYARMIGKILGIEFKYVNGDWAKIQQMAKEKKIDGIRLLIRNEERESYLLFSQPYSSLQHAILTQKLSPDIHSLQNLSNMRVGSMNKVFAHSYMRKNYPDIKLVLFDSVEENLQALVSGEVEASVASLAVAGSTMDEMFVTNLKVTALPEELSRDLHLGIRNDWPELASMIDKAIEAIPPETHIWIKSRWINREYGIDRKKKVQLSAEEKAWLAEGHIVRARVSYWPPLMFKEPELSGIAVDYLKIISERFGINVKFVPDETGFQEGLQDLMGGKKHYDLFLTLKRTPEREEKIAFSDDYISMPWVIYGRQDAAFISGMEDLNGKTVSVEQDFFMEDKLEKEYPSIRLLKVPTSLDALRAVAITQADAYIGNLSNATWLLREHNLDNLKIAAPTPFGSHDNAMGVRNDWPELASIISKGLASMPQNEHNAINNRWLTTYKTEFDYSLVWKILVVTILIITTIAYWNRQLRRKVAARTSELSDSESRFRATFEQAAVGIAHVSPSGHFLRLNQKFCDIVGYSQEEMVSLTFQEITHPEDLGKDLDHVQRLLYGETDSYTMEKRYIRKDSSIVWVNLSVRILLEDDTTPKWFVAVVEDISERKQASENLFKSEAKKSQLLHDIGERLKELNCMYTVSDSIRTRETLGEIFQDTVDAIPPGWHYPEIARAKLRFNKKVWVSEPFEETAWKQSSDIIIDGQKLGTVEVCYLEERPPLDDGPFMKEERDLINGIAQTLAEAIERRESAENLAKSEEKYRSLVDNSLIGVFNSSLDGQFLFVNDALARIYDFDSPEQMLAEGSLPRWVDPKKREQLMSELQERGSVNNFEAETISRTGRHIHMLFSAKLQNEVIEGMVMDITQRKQFERKLQESHASLKHMISSIPEAVFSVKVPERTIEWVNDSYGVMGLGVNPKHIKGKATQEYFVDKIESERFGEIQRKAILAGENFIRAEVMARHRNGSIFPAEITSTFYKEHGVVTKTTAMVRDITDRKQAEKQVLDYQARLKALASQLTLAEEKERRRIAADLHDDVGQTLAISRVQLASAIYTCDDTHQKEQLEEVSKTLLKAIRDTRHLIFELSSPSVHEHGLGPAISEWVEEKIKRTQELDFELVDNLAGNELDEEQRTILFRNLRELLTNTIKHARAKKVNVSLECLDRQLKITVEDDGIGFNPERVLNQLNQEGGFGLFSIDERMADLGGKLEIKSMPHQGCRIIMSLPHNV